MYCKKCWHRNILKAEYCRHCGAPFTDEEREAAYKKTFPGRIDQFLKLKAWVTLAPVTGSLWFRITVLAGILLYALAVLLVNGTHMHIMQSPEYDVQLDTATGVYTLQTQAPSVALRLYIPSRVESYTLLMLDERDNILRQKTVSVQESPVVNGGPGIRYVVQIPDEELTLQLQ
ncbi:MAG: zinc ribbon domain-containing protein [Oscillospiraceae bacterium]|nr:zinc ribbon domain-containing protein [Oscillospiraceae bacterium]